MKRLLAPRPLNHPRSGRLKGTSVIAAIISLVLAVVPGFAQGPYYPLTNPNGGGPYGSTYSGTPITTDADLNFLQQVLQSGMPGPAPAADPTITLQVPIPTGFRAPTTAELTKAVNYAIRAIVSNNTPPLANGVAPSGSVTLASFVNDAISIKPADRSVIISAIGQGVLDSSLSTSAKVTELNGVVSVLALAQPTNATANVSLILAKAATAADPLLPQALTQLVATAISKVPRDSGQVVSLSLTGLSQLSGSTLNAADRKTLILSSYIPTLLASDVAVNNPVMIDGMLRSFMQSYVLTMVTAEPGLTSIDLVLQTSLASLPDSNRFTVGAVATGALRSLGTTYASQVQTRLNTELSGNPALQAYANNVVSGFTASAGTYNGLVTGNANADGVAAGAIARGGAVPIATVIQQALVLGTANPRNVIFATVSANADSAVAIAQAAVQPSGGGFQPYGAGTTFADIIGGAVSAVSKLEQVGPIVSGLIQKTSATLATMPDATVIGIVQEAIATAYSSGKDAAFSDIVAKSAGLAGAKSGLSAPLVTAAIQAINTATTGDPRYPTSQDRPTYVAVVAALGVEVNAGTRNLIKNATLGGGGSLAAVGGDYVAAAYGAAMVDAVRVHSQTKYTAVLKHFDNARLNANAGPSVTNNVLAGLYGATLAASDHFAAVLAAAIKQSTVDPEDLTEVAINAANQANAATYKLVGEVAAYAKQNPGEVLNYVGAKIVTNPALTSQIAHAWVVVDPNHAHWVSHAVAFNNPTGAAGAVSGIFTYTQITNPQPFVQASPGNPTGARLTGIADQPAAAAAIVAGFSSGILESNIPQATRKTAFVSMVAAAVTASSAQNLSYLVGPVNPFNNPGDETASFRQSNGTAWNGGSPLKTVGVFGGPVRTVGAAGAITGYMAQVVKSGDDSLWQAGETIGGGEVAQTHSITAAVLRAAAVNGTSYLLEIAQAAAQAFGWIAGVHPDFDDTDRNAVSLQIAQAMIPSGTLGGKSQGDLFNAARFGFAEAVDGRIGAGALGLGSDAAVNINNKPIVAASGNVNSQFYRHRSATNAPVTDIFNL